MSALPSSAFDQLNDENYEEWSFKIKMHLMRENLWHIVSEPPPSISYYDNWDEKNNKAMAIIGLSLADNQLRHIKNLTNAYDCWIKLKENYEKSISGKKIVLIKKLLKMHLRYNQTMEEHLTNMMEIIGKLLSYGDKIEEKFFITKILATLPYQYNDLIATFESLPEEKLTIEYVNQKLLVEYKEVERKKKNRQPYDRQEIFKGNNNNPDPKVTKSESQTSENRTRDHPPSYDDAVNKNHLPGTSNLYPQISQYKFAPVVPSAPTKHSAPRRPFMGPNQGSNPFLNPDPVIGQKSNCVEQKKFATASAAQNKPFAHPPLPAQTSKPGPSRPSALQCYYCKQAGHRINECQLRMRKETTEAFEILTKQELIQCSFCNKQGHKKENCTVLIQLTQRQICSKCHRTGHTAANCRQGTKPQKKEGECILS